jgi:uncharacterized membrane protein (DUF485 family)
MTQFIQMGWPFAAVLIAALICMTIVYVSKNAR